MIIHPFIYLIFVLFIEGRMLDKEDIAVFQKAAELGIHRTVHAGEAGPAKMVMKVSVPNS